jgi:hypothetical protein
MISLQGECLSLLAAEPQMLYPDGASRRRGGTWLAIALRLMRKLLRKQGYAPNVDRRSDHKDLASAARAMLAVEAQTVIGLRLIKLGTGGTAGPVGLPPWRGALKAQIRAFTPRPMLGRACAEPPSTARSLAPH